MNDISTNLAVISARISDAARQCGRDPASVRLVAVSKTRPVGEIIEARDAGQQIFGENYVQELTAKIDALPTGVEWHMIGHLQSNKVKYIAGKVDMIHSVDRYSLAREIDLQWGRAGMSCDILVQVNISGESSKSGAAAAEAVQLVRECASLQNIRVCGLMTMPPFFDDPEAARPYFAELKRLARLIDSLNIEHVLMSELSMGMSGDFEVAIQEGATLVRVGTAIFGER